MTRKELEKKLELASIPQKMYNLHGGYLGEEHVLNYVNKSCWEVYYFERGNKNALKVFNNEGDACNEIYNRLINEYRKK